MPVCFIMDFPGGTLEQYDQVMELMQLHNELPEHALFHVVGLNGDDLRVADVWESDEAFQAFAQSQIGPHSAAAGIAEPKITRIPVHRIRDARDRGDEIAFLQVVRLPGLDADGFDEADQRITGGEAPEGCVFHVNGADGDDHVVVDVWSSKDIRDRFIEDNVRPVMEDAPLTGPPQFDEIEVHNAMGAKVASTA